jgi:UDP-N-acetylglucosamine 2-epimerase (non-hydrolysing)
VTPASPAVCAFLGTKAQYIKTAPVLHALERRGIPYRLIDSGQHAALSVGMRRDLGLREPDVRLGGRADVTSIAGAVRWATGLVPLLLSRRRLQRDVFGPGAELCLVHGDTPSTLLSALMARRAGVRVAHLEAGLRSRSLLHPFPEELIRLVVMRVAHVLFAPSAEAAGNLGAMRLRRDARVVEAGGNTSADAVARLELAGDVAGSGPAVVTMHRVENLQRRATVDGFVALVERIAARWPVRFVVHGPTAEVLAKAGAWARLDAAGVERSELLAHHEFVPMLAAAPLVVTDGGSIQEECALLGVPTLVWRARTERPDGIGENVVLSRYDPAVVDEFLTDPERWRRPPAPALEESPSERIADVVAAEIAS